MNIQTLQKHLQSHGILKIMLGVGIALMCVLSFSLGVQVGFNKASFNSHRSMGFIPTDVSNSHGVSGRIVSSILPVLVVADKDNTEKVVRISDDTVVRKLRETVSASSLAVGDFITVLGAPNEKTEVEAKLIRILPPPPQKHP